ncbi:VanZ family protein [Rathayibacter festucae]|uniref:VanZ family protein n=1 Tax=Rathayibacter festucae TaxID=110937 RepID=UPI001FB4879E|nr:VanZ family protein [Rathayibacter festucae]MCJ1701156.1 VanZ family protein [Rathayibacter festucae]
MPRPPTRLTVVVALAYALVLAAVVFWPTPVDGGHAGELKQALAQPRAQSLGLLGYSGIEATANVLLFVPLGLLAALHLPGRRAWLAVLLGAATSAAVETVQLLLLPQRHADVHDVLANTAGAAIGAVLGVVLRRRLLARRRRRAAERDRARARVPLHRPPA